MPAITITDLNNAKLDVDHIAEIATSLSDTSTDRLGNTKNTIAHAIELIDADVSIIDNLRVSGVNSINADVLAVSDRADQALTSDIPAAIASLTVMNNRGPWVTATAYTYQDIVSDSGSWYICVVPHTSSGVFATDAATKWRLYQGVTTGDLSASSGSGLVGYSQASFYSYGTLGRKLQEFVSVKDFGAHSITEVGYESFDSTSAIQAAITAATASGGCGTIYFPHGKYISDKILLDAVRSFRIVGECGQDDVGSKGKTWIYWKSGSSNDSLIEFKSCSYLTFEHISLFSNGNTSKNQLILFTCNDTASVKNKWASTRVHFQNVAFVVTFTASMSIATINQKSTIGISYDKCIIGGFNAIKLGANTDVDPITGLATTPDGRAVLTSISNCNIQGNIVRERVLGLSIKGCYFGKNSVPFAEASYRISCLTVAGNEEVRDEVIIGNDCDTVGCTHNATIWYQGPNDIQVDAVGANLVATGNMLNGANTCFDLHSGVATIKSNTFIGLNLSGSIWNAIRLNSGISSYDLSPNNYYGLLALNTESVVANAVTDLRSTNEDGKYLLARSPASDLLITSNNWTTILSNTLPSIEGSFVEASYQITLTTATDGVFSARLILDGVAIPGTTARHTTGTAASLIFVVPFSTRLVKLLATDNTRTRVISLQIKQETGTLSTATVKGDTYGLSSTYALVKVVS